MHDMNATQTISMTTAKGNTLQLFYNNETGLVVVDLVSKDEKGGNEFLRRHIDEDKMIGHTAPKPRNRKTPKTGLPTSPHGIDQTDGFGGDEPQSGN